MILAHLLICLFTASSGAGQGVESSDGLRAPAAVPKLFPNASNTNLSGSLAAAQAPVDIFPQYLMPLVQGTENPGHCMRVR